MVEQGPAPIAAMLPLLADEQLEEGLDPTAISNEKLKTKISDVFQSVLDHSVARIS